MLKKLLLYLLLPLWLYALPQGIEDAIKRSTIPKKDIAIVIKTAGADGKEIAELNGGKFMTPASVIKVLTTYAALLELGFDHRFMTEFYTNGRIENGVLKGDLIIKAYGDPTLSSEDLSSIVTQLQKRGIKEITGYIVIDRSYFQVGTKNSSGFDEYLYSPYNAMPDAMMFNERVSTICINPQKNDIHKKGADQSYIVVNKLQGVNKPCRGKYAWPGIKVDTSSATPRVLLQGQISKRCGNKNICKVITKPYLSFYYALKEALKEAGITAKGTLRLYPVPPDARVLFRYYSAPLEKIISKTAKKSNNLYARHLLLYLGARKYGAPATLQKGRAAVEQILKEHGALGKENVMIDNGSGLSRTAKTTSKALANVLDHAYKHYGERWMNTLSIAGVDGTIRKRFRGSIVKNRAWMKTGTLNRVKNIAGYVKSKKGKLYTVVILVNTNKGRWKAAKLQNEIIKWLVAYKGTPIHTTRVLEDISHVGDSQKETRYYVQVGTYTQIPSRQYLIQFEKLHLPYKIRFIDRYRLLIGPYVKKEDALEALQKVHQSINQEAFLLKDE